MNIFENLTIARQISFDEKDGEMSILAERMVIIPSNIIIGYVESIMEDEEAIKKLYRSVKQTTKEGFAVSVGKKFGFAFKDYTKWFVNLVVVGGWGRVEFVEINETETRCALTARNSPAAMYMKGKAKEPCDHITRALFAGGGSAAFKEDIDAVEVECEALGAQKCMFELGKPDYLKKAFPELYRTQVET